MRQGRPDTALPFAYKALDFIKQVQQASRIYLARVGYEQAPVDENRRLTGKRDGLASRRSALGTGDIGDPEPAALWRALQDARRNGLGVEELVTMIWEVAAEDEREGSPSASSVRCARSKYPAIMSTMPPPITRRLSTRP